MVGQRCEIQSKANMAVRPNETETLGVSLVFVQRGERPSSLCLSSPKLTLVKVVTIWLRPDPGHTGCRRLAL